MAHNYVQGILPLSKLQHPEKYTGKLKDNIVFRSSWELSFIRYLDANPNILEFNSEEVVIIYKSPVDKRDHRYFMDFWFKFKNSKGQIKEHLIEIKPFAQTIQPKLTEGMSQTSKINAVKTYAVNQAKWAAAKAWAYKNNMLFKVLTEKDLTFSKYINNTIENTGEPNADDIL